MKHSSAIKSASTVLVAVFASLSWLSAAYAELSAESVGRVSLVLGQAWIESGDGRRETLAPGASVHVRDRILTEANGHVHIRFVDDALVSVRPDSRLEVVRYDYSPEQPAQSSIKLNLEEGVTRSISGRGATSARERFRLNTPIAAIGVRGTDFVVSATQRSVRALVNEGAIVLAPFSSDCTFDTFGPCVANAVELTDSSLQMVEMRGDSTRPELMPASVEREPGMMREEVRLAIASVEPQTEDTGAADSVYLENVTSVRVKSEAAAIALVDNTPPVQPELPPTSPESPETPTNPPVVVNPPDVTPELPVEAPVLASRNLVWGRWGDGQGEAEKITLAYLDAREGRDVTVGNKEYLLFRDGDGRTRVDAGLGPVSFALSSAQAFYSSETGIVAMTVSGGELDIDFDTSQFNTRLDLLHELTGEVLFTANGRLYDGGYFHSRTETERMAGAVSLDGKEAGYFFEKQLEAGGIKGLTLWDSL